MEGFVPAFSDSVFFDFSELQGNERLEALGEQFASFGKKQAVFFSDMGSENLEVVLNRVNQCVKRFFQAYSAEGGLHGPNHVSTLFMLGDEFLDQAPVPGLRLFHGRKENLFFFGMVALVYKDLQEFKDPAESIEDPEIVFLHFPADSLQDREYFHDGAVFFSQLFNGLQFLPFPQEVEWVGLRLIARLCRLRET